MKLNTFVFLLALIAILALAASCGSIHLGKLGGDW